MDRERSGDTHFHYHQEKTTMRDKYEVGGDVTNSPFGTNQTVRDSFNTISNSGCGDAIKQALKELVQLVGKLREQIEDEAKRQSIDRDLQTLVAEATNAEPRKKWLELSGEGLIDAAQTVAVMTTPITTAVAGLLKLFAAVG
jgi:hypothetical protein